MRIFKSDFEKLSESGILVDKTKYYQFITSIIANKYPKITKDLDRSPEFAIPAFIVSNHNR